MAIDPDAIRELRQSYKLSREQFGELFNVGAETVKSWEMGRRDCVGTAALLVERLWEDPKEFFILKRMAEERKENA